MLNYLVLQVHQFLMKMHRIKYEKAKKLHTKPRKIFLKSNYTLTLLHTPLKIKMYCVFILIILKEKALKIQNRVKPLHNKQL